ncbi:hypothetical protein VT99_13491, partial [Candidatus Electrothrix marina]
ELGWKTGGFGLADGAGNRFSGETRWSAEEESLTLRFAEGELVRHPLQLASLEQEAAYLKNVHFILRFSS